MAGFHLLYANRLCWLMILEISDSQFLLAVYLPLHCAFTGHPNTIKGTHTATKAGKLSEVPVNGPSN